MTRAWVVAAVAAVLLLLVSWARVQLPGLGGEVRPYAGFLVLVLQAALVTAAGLAAAGAVAVATEASFGWRQLVGGIAFAGAVAAPVLGLGWWATTGSHGPLTDGPAASLPAYMTEVSATSDARGVLVLRGGGATSDVRYRVLRDGTLRLGDEGVLALTPEERPLTESLGELLAGSSAPVAQRLASYGVAWVYAPPPVSGAVSGAMDAADGFTGASAPVDGARAWKVDQRATAPARVDTPLHLLAVVLQVVALVAVVVLAAPSRRRRS